MRHCGPAVVFEDVYDLAERVDDPHLEVSADSVLVLRNSGPKGAPGMPEWGQLPIPAKLLEQLTLIGPPEKIRHDLEAWRDSIVTTLLIGGDPATLRQAAEIVLG